MEEVAKPFMLRPSERILLKRALAMYARQYLQMKANSKQPWEKADLQNYIDAADQLAERIRKE